MRERATSDYAELKGAEPVPVAKRDWESPTIEVKSVATAESEEAGFTDDGVSS